MSFYSKGARGDLIESGELLKTAGDGKFKFLAEAFGRFFYMADISVQRRIGSQQS